jgi:hypothetical protein
VFNTRADGHVEAQFPLEADLRQNGDIVAKAIAKFMEAREAGVRLTETLATQELGFLRNPPEELEGSAKRGRSSGSHKET